MSDCGHDHSLEGLARHKADGGRLIAALAVIVVFMVLEVVGGLLSGSLALLADAAHMMTDAFALTLAASAHWMSAKPAGGQLHFGYRRVQVIAAFVNGIALFALMGWIVIEAFRRSVTPIDVAWADACDRRARSCREWRRVSPASPGGQGQYQHQGRDAACRERPLGSVAAVAAAIIIWLTGWTRIDPILSVFVAILIGRSAWKLLKETTHILLEGAPTHIDAERMQSDLAGISPDIEDIHNVRVWQLTPDQLRLTLHARIKNSAAAEDTLQLLKRALSDRYGIRESTIQIEFGAACPDHGGEHTHGGGATVHSLHGHAHGRARGGVATAQ